MFPEFEQLLCMNLNNPKILLKFIEETRNNYIHERLSSGNSISPEEYESYNYMIRQINITMENIKKKFDQQNNF